MTRIEIEIPEDVTASVEHLDLTVEGPEGTVSKQLWFPDVAVSVEDDAVVIESDAGDARTEATMGTFESHVENMIHGVTEGWEYRMAVRYSHFPMQVRVEDDEVVIDNFLGERAPRTAPIRGDTEVQVDGEDVILSGPDKEAVGQTAASIEQLTRVTNKDTRVFQDGVYITHKPGKTGA
ncbi:MAG: 50S ribosomal protein L6 [Halobacteriales archaeon]|nr:50S ribosomal protein L6 [Halobacteriales archaeon]